MFRQLTVRGTDGRIKVGYQTAATIRAFALAPVGPDEWEITGTVASTDAFWLAQPGRVLELTIGKQRWRWPAPALMVDGATVKGTVSGRPERR